MGRRATLFAVWSFGIAACTKCASALECLEADPDDCAELVASVSCDLSTPFGLEAIKLCPHTCGVCTEGDGDSDSGSGGSGVWDDEPSDGGPPTTEAPLPTTEALPDPTAATCNGEADPPDCGALSTSLCNDNVGVVRTICPVLCDHCPAEEEEEEETTNTSASTVADFSGGNITTPTPPTPMPTPNAKNTSSGQSTPRAITTPMPAPNATSTRFGQSPETPSSTMRPGAPSSSSDASLPWYCTGTRLITLALCRPTDELLTAATAENLPPASANPETPTVHIREYGSGAAGAAAAIVIALMSVAGLVGYLVFLRRRRGFVLPTGGREGPSFKNPPTFADSSILVAGSFQDEKM